MTKSTLSKSKMPRKQTKKKQHTIHPYLECIHGEIASLQEELLTIEELQSTRDLTDEEKLNVSIKNACLERYQATLIKLTEQTMANKLNAYTSAAAKATLEIRQKETISFLQLMYLMRLGQLGLYQCIEKAPSLDIVANLCDQIIGAAVYYASESSYIIKEQKRHKVHDLLRKWDQASNDVIDDTVDGTTFKQLKDFLQHLWDNSEEIKNTSHQNNSEQTYAVLQFEGMVPKNTSALEKTTCESQAHEEPNTADATFDLSNHADASSSVETANISESKDEEKKAPVNNGSYSSEKAHRNQAWGEINKYEESILNENGWKSTDHSFKRQSWNNADSQNREKVIEDEKALIQPAPSPVTEDATSPEDNTESTGSKAPIELTQNDDWRRRDESSPGRGRGRGNRGGRGRGKFADRGRGRGGPRGRGRGRGRDFDEDYNRHYEPTALQQD